MNAIRASGFAWMVSAVVWAVSAIAQERPLFDKSLADNHWQRKSDSPLMKISARYAEAKQAQAPSAKERAGWIPRYAENSIVEYDARTGRAELVRRAAVEAGAAGPELAPAARTAGSTGLLSQPARPETVLGSDGRTRITNTGDQPWRTIVKLFMTFPSGNRFIGSGALIGRADGNCFHVLTAGHCVYSAAEGGWASSIEVVPGYDGLEDHTPYHRAMVTNMRTYTQWTNSADWNHDWAVCRLDRRVGNFTGWMGRATFAATDSVYLGTLNIAGYPGDKDSGETLWFDSDVGHSTTDTKHHYYMDSAGGMSGCPVWRYNSTTGERHIVTVHAYGDSGNGANSGTRLNADKFNQINTWIDADALPSDRADLIDDGATYAGFTPTSGAGGTPITIDCQIRNVGTAAGSSCTVSFYLSTNTIISSTDHLIGSTTVTGLNPFSFRSVTFNGTLPAGVPAGNYYVGWIIDSAGSVAEFDESNNTGVKTTALLTVVAPPANDNFAGTTHSGSSAGHAANTSGATKQSGEPNHAGNAGGKSIWYSYTAPGTGSITVSTVGSSFDTLLGVYTGSSVSALSTVASNDDASGSASIVTFACTQGTVYRIAVDGYNGASGNSQVAVTFTPNPVQLVAAASRKKHAAKGNFDLAMSPSDSALNIEPRKGSTAILLFTFNNPVRAADGTLNSNEFSITGASFSAASVTSNVIRLDIAGVANLTKVTVQLNGIVDAAGTALSGDRTV